MLRVARNRVSMRRFFSSEAKEEVKKVTEEVQKAPAALAKQPKSVSRTAWFLSGLTVGGGVGYYFLREDLNNSTEQLNDAIVALKHDVIHNNQNLTERLNKLEQQNKK